MSNTSSMGGWPADAVDWLSAACADTAASLNRTWGRVLDRLPAGKAKRAEYGLVAACGIGAVAWYLHRRRIRRRRRQQQSSSGSSEHTAETTGSTIAQTLREKGKTAMAVQKDAGGADGSPQRRPPSGMSVGHPPRPSSLAPQFTPTTARAGEAIFQTPVPPLVEPGDPDVASPGELVMAFRAVLRHMNTDEDRAAFSKLVRERMNREGIGEWTEEGLRLLALVDPPQDLPDPTRVLLPIFCHSFALDPKEAAAGIGRGSNKSDAGRGRGSASPPPVMMRTAAGRPVEFLLSARKTASKTDAAPAHAKSTTSPSVPTAPLATSPTSSGALASVPIVGSVSPTKPTKAGGLRIQVPDDLPTPPSVHQMQQAEARENTVLHDQTSMLRAPQHRRHRSDGSTTSRSADGHADRSVLKGGGDAIGAADVSGANGAKTSRAAAARSATIDLAVSSGHGELPDSTGNHTDAPGRPQSSRRPSRTGHVGGIHGSPDTMRRLLPERAVDALTLSPFNTPHGGHDSRIGPVDSVAANASSAGGPKARERHSANGPGDRSREVDGAVDRTPRAVTSTHLSFSKGKERPKPGGQSGRALAQDPPIMALTIRKAVRSDGRLVDEDDDVDGLGGGISVDASMFASQQLTPPEDHADRRGRGNRAYLGTPAGPIATPAGPIATPRAPDSDDVVEWRRGGSGGRPPVSSSRRRRRPSGSGGGGAIRTLIPSRSGSEEASDTGGEGSGGRADGSGSRGVSGNSRRGAGRQGSRSRRRKGDWNGNSGDSLVGRGRFGMMSMAHDSFFDSGDSESDDADRAAAWGDSGNSDDDPPPRSSSSSSSSKNSKSSGTSSTSSSSNRRRRDKGRERRRRR